MATEQNNEKIEERILLLSDPDLAQQPFSEGDSEEDLDMYEASEAADDEACEGVAG